MTANPWLSRFDDIDSAEIGARFTYVPDPIDPAQCADRADLDSKITSALAKLAIPSTQSVALCSLLVARAHAHAAAVYPGPKEFLSQCYRKDGPEMPEESFPICLIGPAGIGKTTLIGRMSCVFPAPSAVVVDEGHRSFPIVSAWYLSAKKQRTITSMLRCLILAAGATPCGKSIEELANQCRRLAYASGICMIFLDEIQFLTKSQGATARITDVVYELMGLGVPITLVANYSLASALKRRPEQDRQRILGNTRILYQVPATSNDWINLVRGVVSISPSVIKIDPEEHASSVHNLTAGTPRMLSFLITHALASTRAARPEVRLDDLQKAYEAPEFSVCRESIEKLNQQFATGEQARADLWPPIRVPLEPQAALKQEAQEQAFARSANSLVEGYLSPSQLELLEELRQNHNASAEDETVVPIGKKAQPTIDDFDVGESILNKLRKKK